MRLPYSKATTFWLLGIFNFFRQFVFPRKKNIEDEVALITGAGSGLGRLMCLHFARLGARVVAWDIDKQGLEGTKRLVENETNQIIATYVCDVSQAQTVYKTADLVVKEIGPVGILINNAGIVNGTDFLETSDAAFERTLRVNVLAHTYTVRAFLPGMIKRERGHLVFIASCAGFVSAPKLVDYCASKGADVLFAEALDTELEFRIYANRARKVALTTVCPFFIRTGMFEGCSSKLNFLLPDLQPEYVVQRIMQAVLAEQRLLVIPRMLYLIGFLKTVLPVSALMELLKLSGAVEFMDTFTNARKRDD